MPSLDHARRTLERATYAPIKRQVGIKGPLLGRAWEKWSYLAALAITRAEFGGLIGKLTEARAIAADQQALLSGLQELIPESPENPPASLPFTAVGKLGAISAETLSALGRAVLDSRKAAFILPATTYAALLAGTARTAPAAAGVPSGLARLPSRLQLDPTISVRKYPGAQIFRYSETTPAALPASRRSPPRTTRGGRKLTTGATGGKTTIELAMVRPAPPAGPKAPSAPPAPPSGLPLGQLLGSADPAAAETATVRRALDAARGLGIAGDSLTIAGFQQACAITIKAIADVNFAFGQRMQVEPVGLLHLERIGFTPAGIERGELIHSVPLSPGETVNVSHKEWSNTSEEFQSIVTDFLEQYSEQGVAEKSELTQAANSQSQHASGFNLGVTASGGFGPVSITTSTGVNVSSSSSESLQVARQHSSEMTRKASSRAKKEHKISFKVASASGTVDQAVRTITNPFTDHATRVDYYQLLRRWRVDLSRYGVRLTYDISIPEPGSEVLDKIVQINALAAALQQGFNAPDSTLPWARFEQANGQPLGPGDINRDNFMALAAQFGTAVETPPDEIVQFTRSYTAQIDTDAAGNRQWTSYQVDVPEGYEIVGVSLIPYWSDWLINDEVQDNTIFHIVTDLSTWFGDTGQVSFAVALQHIQAYEIELNVWFEWTNASFQAWQMRVWSQLYDAAKARYELNRTMLKDQLTALQEQLGAQDPLSLRQLEREEVMKNVLRWLFGPGFTFTPPGLPADLYKSNESIASSAIWSKVLAEGEIIKFLHHAIEWENMLYLLYPYFWSDTSRWELKRYLEHPDFMHRTFLRAGSARVILTIRPGFETDFVSFMDTGSLGGLAVNPPYLTIAQEMQAFAQTNYPNTPMANPDQSVRPLLTPRQRKAWDDMQAIMALLEKYKTDNGAYPGTQPGLAALAGLGPVPAKDPWGHAYDYKSPGIYADYELQSFGADGVAGGEDENADIVSWAEGSLVGRWYEFTPTSALDIAFNETMPTA